MNKFLLIGLLFFELFEAGNLQDVRVAGSRFLRRKTLDDPYINCNGCPHLKPDTGANWKLSHEVSKRNNCEISVPICVNTNYEFCTVRATYTFHGNITYYDVSKNTSVGPTLECATNIDTGEYGFWLNGTYKVTTGCSSNCTETGGVTPPSPTRPTRPTTTLTTSTVLTTTTTPEPTTTTVITTTTPEPTTTTPEPTTSTIITTTTPEPTTTTPEPTTTTVITTTTPEPTTTTPCVTTEPPTTTTESTTPCVTTEAPTTTPAKHGCHVAGQG